MTNGKTIPPSLVYINDFSLGYKRVKQNDEFIYQNYLGKPIENGKNYVTIDSCEVNEYLRKASSSHNIKWYSQE